MRQVEGMEQTKGLDAKKKEAMWASFQRNLNSKSDPPPPPCRLFNPLRPHCAPPG